MTASAQPPGRAPGAAARILAAAARLGPPHHERVVIQRDLRMVADDGSVLLADRWAPAGVDARTLPVVLFRSPYGRRPFGPLAETFALRGYQAVVQSCRGTFGSGGTWEPFRHEQADGRRCLEWLAEQPWWSGSVATAGPSYLGLTQWAVLADPPPWLEAASLQVTASRFRDIVVYPGGTFALETGAAWLHLLDHQERPRRQLVTAQLRARRALAGAGAALPLTQADAAVLGHAVAHYQDWLVHERPGDPWWDPVDFSGAVATAPPAVLVGGWWDIFLPSQVDDFRALRAAGRDARLVVGPWTHSSLRQMVAALGETHDWFARHVRPERPPTPGTRRGPEREDRAAHRPQARPRVRLAVVGGRRWVEAEEWPPPHLPVAWHLHGDGRLAPEGASRFPPTSYSWDPSEPTPGVGGPSLDPSRAGKRNQRRREERSDVATWTGDPLAGDLTAVGPVEAVVWLRASSWWTDLFVRLCDVDRRGRSVNLADGILRLEPDGAGVRTVGSAADGSVGAGADGSVEVRIRMWPIAATWRKGHRIRVQVSGGAHPLFARNLGGGEPLASASTLVTVVHEILHDPDHPSRVVLPYSSL